MVGVPATSGLGPAQLSLAGATGTLSLRLIEKLPPAPPFIGSTTMKYFAAGRLVAVSIPLDAAHFSSVAGCPQIPSRYTAGIQPLAVTVTCASRTPSMVVSKA